MTNAVATQADNLNPFEAYGQAVSSRTIVGELLKFSKGEYTFGQNDTEVDEGTKLVANMDELMVGWVKWEDGKPVEHLMGRVIDGFKPERRSALGDNDQDEWETDDNSRPRDPWQLTNYLLLKDPDGDQLYTFATSSRGGLNAIGELCKTFGRQMRQRPTQFPVIELNVDSYRHSNKAYGKIFVPKFDVAGWAEKAEFAEALEAADQEAAAEDKARKERDDMDEVPARSKPREKAGAETRF